MDFGTIFGLIGCNAVMVGAILYGSPFSIFVDIPSILIVGGGAITALMINFTTGQLKDTLFAIKNAVMFTTYDTKATVKLLEELSNRARREGLLSLEEAAEKATDPFMKKGLRMMADGHEASIIESVLFDEIGKTSDRHKANADAVGSLADIGPAMGMLGTLIGLVQMLQKMSDPAAIGPAMAVALLTTLYGSVLANIFGTPVANKMKARSADEIAHKELIAAGLISILNGENPRFMVERLNSTLAPKDRVEAA